MEHVEAVVTAVPSGEPGAPGLDDALARAIRRLIAGAIEADAAAVPAA